MTAVSENGPGLGVGRLRIRLDQPLPPELLLDPGALDDDVEAADVVAAPPSRAELRRRAEESARAERSRRSVWRAWWLYPLVAGVLVCGWLGYQSASAPAPQEPIVVPVPGS
jgi:hypothetical protein